MFDVESGMDFYTPSKCVTFRKTKEAWGGLSNMAAGFPLRVMGREVATSESLYQACRFPSDPELQAAILAKTNPMGAKMMTKPHRARTRGDWETPSPGARVAIMAWCLRIKLIQNMHTFGDLLMRTGRFPIVEDSHKDLFWGAVTTQGGERPGDLYGENMLGQLLMQLREEVRVKGVWPATAAPPDLPDFKLCGELVTVVDTAG